MVKKKDQKEFIKDATSKFESGHYSESGYCDGFLFGWRGSYEKQCDYSSNGSYSSKVFTELT